MGDDFDLFPKRENLDPFSFKTKEKKTEQPEESEDLFGVEEKPSPPSPEAPPPGEPDGEPSPDQPAAGDAPAPDQFPPLELPPEPVKQPEPVPAPEPEGPISESKTFDEPENEITQLPEESGKKKKKSHSPFIVVGGALLIIIGLLYLALTFLKSNKPPAPSISVPKASAPIKPQPAAPVPVPKPVKPKQVPEPEKPEGTPAGAEKVAQPSPEAVETGTSGQQAPAVMTEVKKPAAPEPVEEKGESQAAVAAMDTEQDGGRYSVQTGAFILEASVRELEKEMDSLGYKTFRKVGSTTALMNMLTVGPFSTVEKAQKAVSDLKEADIDSNLVRRSGGGAIVNAGSYLLDENAKIIERKIRNMGYPVSRSKKEARLPMTFVRTGRFEGLAEATRLRDELKEKGLDAIVVKLQ